MTNTERRVLPGVMSCWKVTPPSGSSPFRKCSVTAATKRRVNKRAYRSHQLGLTGPIQRRDDGIARQVVCETECLQDPPCPWPYTDAGADLGKLASGLVHVDINVG
jgi:hypothetical protein